MSPRSARAVSLVLIVLLLLVLLGMGAAVARHRFLTRGMPDALPGPNPHASVSPYGINVDLLQAEPADQQAALAYIAAAGFRWIKQPVPWGQEGNLPALIDAATRLELNVVLLLDGDPGTGYAPPTDPQEMAAWAGTLAARYSSQVTYYQVWDEPNLGSHWGGGPVNPADYVALLASAHEAIRAADPDAVIVAAALAPTLESGRDNLSDVEYLAQLYRLGADAYFDVVAGKPYGFDSGPDDRRVDKGVLNFSRLILLREVMERNGDGDSALWAGNFGWNALSTGWTGRPSLWGQTDVATQAAHTRAAYQRAIDEWPWAGVLFLENYAPAAAPDDPRWGFALVDQNLVPRSPLLDGTLSPIRPTFQMPDPAVQAYSGSWRFDPAFGADISESGDSVRFEFDGTDLGVRVRRGDYRAYFYVTVDGQPANALPQDGRGAYLNLTSPDRSADDVVTIPVARHLAPGRHVAELVAERGWGQWALAGFSAANLPDQRPFHRALAVLGLVAAGLTVGAVWTGRRAAWGPAGQRIVTLGRRLGGTGLWVVAAAVAAIFALTGWLTWLHPAGGVFRRLDEGSQALLVTAGASLFYFSPWFLLNLASGLFLLILIFWRLELGLALIALSAPFYVYPKPMAGYSFSPVEMFTLITFAAWTLNLVLREQGQKLRARWAVVREAWLPLDGAVAAFMVVATLSLLFTDRLDVASNEWRMVVLEPVLFYTMLRTTRLRNPRLPVDGLVLGGIAVALLGLGWYAAGEHVITAEGGLPRLRSIYGSPNNVGLYLGRVIPILLAVALTARGQRRRRGLYALGLLPVLAAAGLSFSKGALLLGLPVGIGFVLAWFIAARWGRRQALGLAVGLLLLALLVLAAASQVPALAGRLSLTSATTDFRVNLWRASVAMIRDHPWTGVGLDNFLYAYRGRYILPEAWQEPDLSHPHNIVLDLWTRLGILGLAAGFWIQISYWRIGLALARHDSAFKPWVVGLLGAMAATLAHGLVDQSYFLIDLAFAFMLSAGLIGNQAAALASASRTTTPTAISSN
jgi:O-antigen ligase